MLSSRIGLGARLGARAARPVVAPSAPRIITAKRTILEGWGVPQPPGNIVGTVNEAVKVPSPNAAHGSYHWDFERLIAVGLVPLTVLPLATGSLAPSVDALFGGLLVAHCHMGFNSCITDYIPKRKFPRGHYVFMGLLYAASGATLWGVYKLETEQDGLAGAVKQIWNA